MSQPTTPGARPGARGTPCGERHEFDPASTNPTAQARASLNALVGQVGKQPGIGRAARSVRSRSGGHEGGEDVVGVSVEVLACALWRSQIFQPSECPHRGSESSRHNPFPSSMRLKRAHRRPRPFGDWIPHRKGSVPRHPWSGSRHRKPRSAIPTPPRPGDLRLLTRQNAIPESWRSAGSCRGCDGRVVRQWLRGSCRG
jgi:hypothetical protein